MRIIEPIVSAREHHVCLTIVVTTLCVRPAVNISHPRVVGKLVGLTSKTTPGIGLAGGVAPYAATHCQRKNSLASMPVAVERVIFTNFVIESHHPHRPTALGN